MRTYETPGGKVIQVKTDPKSGFRKVEFATGGELPEELTGIFNTDASVNSAILRYLDKQNKKASKEK